MKDIPDGLIAALMSQRQIDRDGTEVGVSRQAIDQAIELIQGDRRFGANMSKTERVWVVIDEDGLPDFCCHYPEACHEHINDAIADGIGCASKWTVREFRIVEPSANVTGESGV